MNATSLRLAFVGLQWSKVTDDIVHQWGHLSCPAFQFLFQEDWPEELPDNIPWVPALLIRLWSSNLRCALLLQKTSNILIGMNCLSVSLLTYAICYLVSLSNGNVGGVAEQYVSMMLPVSVSSELPMIVNERYVCWLILILPIQQTIHTYSYCEIHSEFMVILIDFWYISFLLHTSNIRCPKPAALSVLLMQNIFSLPSENSNSENNAMLSK